MKLADVTAHALSSPIEPVQERPFAGGVRRLHKRDVVVVLLETADGLRGVAPAGASSSAMREFFEDASQATFAAAINEHVAPALSGAEVETAADIPDLLAASELPDRIQSEAAAALDVAYHDVRGRRQGVGIGELLANAHETNLTSSMELYASAGMYMEPAGYGRQAELLETAGFLGYKYRPGIGPDHDRETVDLLADRLTDSEFMLDSHTWWKTPGDTYDRSTVVNLVEHAGKRGAMWVEEPVEPDDYDGYRTLGRLGVPLAGGESEPSPEGLISLAETGAVSFLQGDVRHHGGYTGCWRAAAAARERDITFVPHHFGTWLGLAANAQLVAALPDGELLEYPVFTDDPVLRTDEDPGMYPFDLAYDIIEETPTVEDGTLTIPDGDGLGVTFNDEVIDAYPFQEGPWTEFIME